MTVARKKVNKKLNAQVQKMLPGAMKNEKAVNKAFDMVAKKLSMLMTVWVVIRILAMIMDFVVCSMMGEAASSASNSGALIMTIFFAVSIKNGCYKAAWLPLVGAVLSIFVVGPSNIILCLLSSDITFILYGIVMILSIVAQAGIMGYVVSSKQVKYYSNRIEELRQDIETQLQGSMGI